MKSARISMAVVAMLVFTGFAAPTASAITKPKSAGRTSNSIPNTILNGKGAPLASLGIDGDFYIDTRSLLIYGPKKLNKWPSSRNLQGPVGPTGADGKNGAEGKNATNAASVTGPAGAKGEKGDPGAPGATGATGLAGAIGLQGPAGSSGGGGGGTPGATGAQGPTGATGPQGAAGDVGATGATGATGERGPSNVYYGAFDFPDINGGSGTSQFATLSGFKAGQSYLVDVSIVVYQPTRNIDNALPLGVLVSNNLGTASIWYKYETSKGRSFRTGASSDRFEYSASVQLVLDGTTSSDYSLNFQLSIGADTGTHLAKAEALFTATQVGSVGNL